MSLRSNEFIKNNKVKNENVFRLAVVTEIREGKIFITYHGEEVQSEKPYKKLRGSAVDVGDLVCIAKINNAGVILGKITTENSDEAAKRKVASAKGSKTSLYLAAKTITKITLDTWNVRNDTSFTFSDGGVKCPYDGQILVTGNVYFGAGESESSRRGVYIYKNGEEVLSQYLDVDASGAGAVGSGTAVIQVTAGDIITLNARQKTATTCVPNNAATSLVVAYV